MNGVDERVDGFHFRAGLLRLQRPGKKEERGLEESLYGRVSGYETSQTHLPISNPILVRYCYKPVASILILPRPSISSCFLPPRPQRTIGKGH